MKQMNTYFEQILRLCINYAPKVLMAVALLVVGLWIIKRVMRGAMSSFEKSKISSPELKTFFYSMVNIGLKILLLISVAGVVGIETTSFVGIIAALGFAIGLSLQGNLANFAAGVLILILRPFKVGDEVKISGTWAFVKEIQMFHTILKKFDQTEMIIPNGLISSEGIHNLSATPARTIPILLRIPFNENLNRIISIVKEAAYSIPEVDQSGEPFLWITDTETHYIQMYAYFNTSQAGFWTTDFKVRKAVIEAFYKYKVKVVYPDKADFGEYNTDEQS